jgi:hypothetical protein
MPNLDRQDADPASVQRSVNALFDGGLGHLLQGLPAPPDPGPQDP